MSNPYNIGFTPIFYSELEHREFANSQPDLFPNFSDWFDDNLKRHNTMILKMKLFIIDNWEKCDWSDIGIKIDGIRYCKKHDIKYKENGEYETIIDKIFDKSNRTIKNVEYVKFTYDYSDGDLSLEINEETNWKFLADDEIIDLALKIENELNKKDE